MEESEVPTEHLQESIQEHARAKGWSFFVALSTAIMAVLAAISSLIAGDNVNEALIAQVKSSDQWAYYQAKGIKYEIAGATGRIISSANNKVYVDSSKIARYEADKEQIRVKAESYEKQSEALLIRHKILARAVTLFQIAIAISAISILSKKRSLWITSIILALIGVFFLLQGTLF